MTKLEEMAKAQWAASERPDADEEWAIWPETPRLAAIAHEGNSRQEWRDLARAGLLALREPDMNIIMRIAGETGMRPTEINLAVTKYIEAILKEAQ